MKFRTDAIARLRCLFVLAAQAAALQGCGGGGASDAGQAAPAPAASAASAAPAAPAPAVTTPVVLSTCGLSDFANRALTRINQLRASGADCHTAGKFAPTTPLAWNTLLTQAADGHSQDMAARNYFSHTSADGRTLSTRVNATGYAWSSLGENIAAGYATVDSVMDGWTASDGHCANLMNPSFTEVGLACVPGGSTATYGNYWTMDLGRPR